MAVESHTLGPGQLTLGATGDERQFGAATRSAPVIPSAEEGDTLDTVYFSRAGVKGTLQVQHDQFELRAELGFLVGAFKSRIEQEIAEQLDTLLHPAEPGKKHKHATKKKKG